MFEAKVKRYRAKLIKMGKVEGRVEGKAEERAEAEKKQREEKRQIACRFVQEGMAREKVKSIMGLSDEDMEGI